MVFVIKGLGFALFGDPLYDASSLCVSWDIEISSLDRVLGLLLRWVLQISADDDDDGALGLIIMIVS